jgi:hypothetical protein
MSKHLWEVDHSYYCGVYGGDRYDNLDDFLDEWGDCDPDYNLLFRWDWNEYDPDEFEDDELDEDHSTKDILNIFWVQQRKGSLYSCKVRVSKDEEDKVKEFLEPRWSHLASLWEPLV